MPATYEPIATTTLTASSTTTFSSITSAYTDLRLVWAGTNSASLMALRLRFNGDTASNYSETEMYGNGTSAGSFKQTGQLSIKSITDFTAGQSSNVIWDIFSYGGSTNKTVLCNMAMDNNGSGYVTRMVGLWRNTAAITSITVTPDTGTITGVLTLYGIKAA